MPEGMKRQKTIPFRLGPDIPLVPIGDFGSMPLTHQQWLDLWSVCGPSAQRNMAHTTRRPPLELWQVITAAYFEGLIHGAGLAEDGYTQPESPAPISTPNEPAKRNP